MKKTKRIISILLMAIIMFAILSVNVSVQAVTLGEMSTKISSFKSKGTVDTESIDTGAITTEFASLAKILVTIGAGVLVIIITYMGIKYFISSPEEQAKLKGQLIGIVASAVVIFGAFSIWELAINIFKDI